MWIQELSPEDSYEKAMELEKKFTSCSEAWGFRFDGTNPRRRGIRLLELF